VQNCGQLSDAVLDFQSELLKVEFEGRAVLGAFFHMRRVFGNRYYLSFYRLRAWLENQFLIRCSGGEEEMTIPLDGRFRSLEQIERRARHLFFEHHLQIEDPSDVRLDFLFNAEAAEVLNR